MQKKWQATFVSDHGNFAVHDLRLVTVPLPKDGYQFMHLEKKGKQWLLLHTEGFLIKSQNPVVITVHRCTGPHYQPTLVLDEGVLVVSRYTAISTINKSEFYHLDELDDHTFRITHGLGFFNGASWVDPSKRDYEHKSINQIILEVADAN